MPPHRFYFKLAIYLALVAFFSPIAGCWEKIEYTGSTSPPPASEPKVAATGQKTAPAENANPVQGTAASPAESVVAEAPPVLPSPQATSPIAPSPPKGADDDRYGAPSAVVDSGTSASAPVVTGPPPAVPSPDIPISQPADDRYAASAPVTTTAPTEKPSASTMPSPAHTSTSGTPLKFGAPNVSQPNEATHAPATGIALPAPDPPKALSSHRAAWLLGSRLSLAALANDRHVAAKNVPVWLAEAQAAAKSLGTTFPELPPPSTASNSDAASPQVLNYLLDVQGQRIGRELTKQHRVEDASLFEIALKSNVLLLLYQPGTPTADSVSAAIQDAGPRAKLPTKLWWPLVDALNNQAPLNEVRAAVRKMHVDVDQYLAGGVEQNSR